MNCSNHATTTSPWLTGSNILFTKRFNIHAVIFTSEEMYRTQTKHSYSINHWTMIHKRVSYNNSSSLSFSRVLPLPSSSWTEAVGDFFCHTHPHGHTHSNGDREDDDSLHHSRIVSGVAPRKRDLLVGSDQLILHLSLCSAAFQRTNNNVSHLCMSHTLLRHYDIMFSIATACWHLNLSFFVMWFNILSFKVCTVLGWLVEHNFSVSHYWWQCCVFFL